MQYKLASECYKSGPVFLITETTSNSYQIISLGGQLQEVNQITARVREIKSAPLSNVTSFPDKMPIIAPHSFHQLVLTNITDLITHSQVSNLVQVSEITYRIHKKDTVILVTASEQ
jgi:hypothetical protein